jgi:hypothetical protein
MSTILDPTLIDTTLFHCRAGGFPLPFCSYTLLDTDGNEAGDPAQIVIVRVTTLNGERFRLRDPDDICRFLEAIGRTDAREVAR